MTTFTSQNALFAPILDEPKIDGLFSTDAFLASFTRFEVALTKALIAVGQVDADLGAQVVTHMENFAPDAATFSDRIISDGLAVPAYVAALKTHVGEPAANAVHVGSTSQDLIDTSFSLAFVGANELLATRLASVLDALTTLAVAQGSHELMGRTRMQAALPITAQDRVRVWQSPLARLADRLPDIRKSIEVVQFGGPVGDRRAYGDKHEEIEAHLSEALGLSATRAAWHSDRHGLVAYGDFLSHVTGALGKIGQDICLMAQQGVDEVRLKGGGTSSAMPHKQNPIPAELLVTLARFNAVQIAGLHQALVHEQERSGAMWTLEWMVLPEMVRVTAKALSVTEDVIGRIESIGSD